VQFLGVRYVTVGDEGRLTLRVEAVTSSQELSLAPPA